MVRNREALLIETSLNRAHRMGKLLFVLFVCAACFSVLFICSYVALIFLTGNDIVHNPDLIVQLVYSLIETLAMCAVYIICALVARDVSKGETPFTRLQIRRMSATAWIMLGFTILSFVWSPLTTSLQAAMGAFDVGFVSTPNTLDFHINFGALVAAGAFFLFAYILDYGKTLQELADETA